ncbi:hypothetical protein BRC64_11045 [Halobacteriales archaeon QH_10_67_22]|nr:MAG: hypothetical protein BRC64_11045 [Halobacteriales archaeon QH_10_67_22]
MNRRLLAAGLLVLLVGLAGCASFLGSDDPDPEELEADGEYDWETPANTTYNVSRSQFQAVIAVENQSNLVVYRTDELGTDEPMSLRALQFRYPNGTVVTANASNLGATTEGQRTNLSLPQEQGQVAFTSPRPNAKRFSIPVFREGSHAVILPPRARVGIPLLSNVNPGNYNTSVADNRMTIRWGNADRGPVVTRYYLQRDLLIFGSVAAVLLVAGVVGGLYYYRQIRTLQAKREEIGLDVEMDDDEFDDGPPPGMR